MPNATSSTWYWSIPENQINKLSPSLSPHSHERRHFAETFPSCGRRTLQRENCHVAKKKKSGQQANTDISREIIMTATAVAKGEKAQRRRNRTNGTLCVNIFVLISVRKNRWNVLLSKEEKFHPFYCCRAFARSLQTFSLLQRFLFSFHHILMVKFRYVWVILSFQSRVVILLVKACMDTCES